MIERTATRFTHAMLSASAAGMVKDRSKIPSAKEGLLWTNKYAK